MLIPKPHSFPLDGRSEDRAMKPIPGHALRLDPAHWYLAMTAGLLSVPLGAVSRLTAGRGQMGTSLSFHLFFAVLGVGLPLMMLIAEGMHLRTGDPVWRALARRWSKVFAILFAVGAASGTIISFELGLLWPRFMAFAGGIIGLPFSLEGAAFFLEAVFVGIYLYGWDRLSPRVHWLSGFPIALASAASAFFIVTANAWMNVPRGFQIVHGRVTHVNVLAAMFNPAWATETTHMVLGAYLATTFGVAAVYAVGMLRGRRDSYHRKAITVSLSLAAIIAPLQLGVGDLLGRTVAQHQPATLAAIDGVTHTESGAGLNVGGIQLPGHATTVLNVKVPNLIGSWGDSARRGAGPATGDPRAWRCASARARVRARAALRRLSRGSGRRCWSSGGDAAGPVPQRQ